MKMQMRCDNLQVHYCAQLDSEPYVIHLIQKIEDILSSYIDKNAWLVTERSESDLQRQ